MEHDGKTGEQIPLDRLERFYAAVWPLPEEHREVFSLVWQMGLDPSATATIRVADLQFLANN